MNSGGSKAPKGAKATKATKGEGIEGPKGSKGSKDPRRVAAAAVAAVCIACTSLASFGPFDPFDPFDPSASFGAFASFGASGSFGAFGTAGTPEAIGAQAKPATRIISLVPALTEMVFAINAGDRVIAVSSYDQYPPEVKALPRVGALLDPDVERIIALRPDLVLLYGSQTDLMAQLQRASIPYYEYRHGDLATVTATIRALGARTGRADAAESLAAGIERRLADLRRRTAGGAKPRTLLVFGRERGSLRNIYASGGRGFLHDILEIAGGVNVFADIKTESVQASSEQILARAPDVIVEVRSTEKVTDAEQREAVASWSALGSLPAVKNRQVVVLGGQGLVVPGPRIADSAEALARALHRP